MVTDRQPPGEHLGRVLVLLDGSPPSRSALVAAAELAQARGADVLGIFVEETNLLRSGGYGFAREIGASSGQIRPLNTSRIEARMQALAREARAALQQVMLEHGIHQALKLCRGHVVNEVLSLARPEDLVIMGRTGWSASSRMLLGSSARSLVRQAPGDVLLWSEYRLQARGRVVVLLNHDQGANHRAVGTGADLARRHHQPLTILVRTDTGDDSPLTDSFLSDLQQTGLTTRIRLLPMTGAAGIIRALREENATQLVLSRSCRLFNDPQADALLDAMQLPITVTS